MGRASVWKWRDLREVYAYMSLREEKILPQFKLSSRIGGLKEQAGHAMFYINLPMALVNWSVGYYATPLHDILPVYAWYGLVPFLFGGAVAFHHIFVHKSWVAFNTEQGADTEVNPQYRRMLDDHDELADELEEIRAALERLEKEN